MDITIDFPGGQAVDAHVGPHTIHTDQDGSAPDPFTLFLSSLAACAGFYVLAYCRTRSLPTDGIRLVQHSELPGKIRIAVELPAGFPDEHRAPIERAAATCKVKKLLASPPQIEVAATVAQEAGTLLA